MCCDILCVMYVRPYSRSQVISTNCWVEAGQNEKFSNRVWNFLEEWSGQLQNEDSQQCLSWQNSLHARLLVRLGPFQKDFWSYHIWAHEESGLYGQNEGPEIFFSDTLFVTYFNSDSGHNIYDFQTEFILRVNPVTRNRLDNAAESRIECKGIKRMTRIEAKKADFLGGESGENYIPLGVLDNMRIKNMDFNDFRMNFWIKSAQLHSSCWQSLSKICRENYPCKWIFNNTRCSRRLRSRPWSIWFCF